MLGLAKMIASKLAPKDTKDAGHTEKGAAVGPSTASPGSGSSVGYAMPGTHLSAAGQGPGQAAMAQAHAGGTYAPGMTSAAVPSQMGPPAPTVAPSATPGSQADIHQGLQQFFHNLGKSGQMAADVYRPSNAPLPQAQGPTVAQNEPQQGLGLGRYFMGKMGLPGGMA